MFAEFIETIIHIIFFTGVIVTILGFVSGIIPFINRYKLPIQIIGVLLLTYGAYLEGGLSKDKKHQQDILKLENKLKDAEVRSGKTNVRIVTEVVTKREVIKEKGEDVIRYIDREVTRYDNTCPIPESVIKAHNAAATNKKPEELVYATPTTPVETKSHNDAAKPNMLLPKK